MACSCCHPTPVDSSLSAFLLIMSKLNALEALMATAAEQIAALDAKLKAQGAVLTDLSDDVPGVLGVELVAVHLGCDRYGTGGGHGRP